MDPEDRDDRSREASPDDEALLIEIRENYHYASEYWRQAREERATDQRYLDGDPWEPDERKAREDADRPCISHDELNQYVHQTTNQARQQKRGVKIEPRGNGANDKSAQFRQNFVRGIEYASQAPTIYLRGYQDCVEGGYGFCRVTRRYVSYDSDEQEIVVKPIPNPNSVLYCPDTKEPDWRDAPWAFVVDPLPKSEFKRRWPKAKVTDFSGADMKTAPDWITDKNVLVAEYWKIEQIETGKKTPKGRAIVKPRLMQYMTNGIEILERNPQPDVAEPEIPLPAFIGEERWTDDEAGGRRKLNSLIRRARDPQMSLAYLCSQQMEEAGLSPKTPYVGYTGQFETDKDAWDTATKEAHAYLQADPIPDSSNNQVLALPRREPFTPNFIAYEAAKDSARRAIQAAIGTMFLPTAAQRDNQKSGKALDRIAAEQAIGSYHFVDGLDRAITRVGRIIESWIPIVYDTEREISLRMADDTAKLVKVNTDQPYQDPDTGETVHYKLGDGRHDTTVSTGPSYDSQRDAVSDFLDTIVANLPNLPIPPAAQAQILAITIRMKQLGPRGDEMAEIISPTGNQQIPPAALAQVQAMQAQLQTAGALVQELQAKIQELALEKAAKIVDNQFKLTIEKMRIEGQAAAAEITTKAQRIDERLRIVEDLFNKLTDQAHERGMQAAEQAHQIEMQSAEQAHAQAMAEQQPPPAAAEPLPRAA